MEFARRFWALVVDVGYLMDEDGLFFFKKKKSIAMMERKRLLLPCGLRAFGRSSNFSSTVS